MSQTNKKYTSIVLSVLLLAPTIGILLTSTALAQEDDIRVIAIYGSFADIPADSHFSGRGIAPGYRFSAIPAIILGGAASSIEDLRTDAQLTDIVYDGPLQFHLETAVVATKARDVWGTAWHAQSGVAPLLKDGEPIDGRGVTVGIVDSGANALHPDLWYAPAAVPGGPLQPKIVACVHTTGIIGPAITVPTPNCDENVGHGTHVAGIVAGNGMMADMGFTVSGAAEYNGAAPGAQLAVAGLGVETIALGGLVIDGLAGLDWQYANADLLGIRVVTNSWSSSLGCTGNWNNDGDAYHAISNKLVQDKGITVLWASNNNGGGAIGTSPQGRNTLPGVIMVANYDDKGSGTRDGDVAGSSGDGCVVSGGSASNMIWTWPDVAAPGTNIVSTAAGIDGLIGMTPVFVGSTPNDAPYYTTLSGTSMATPHVAGVVALLYQAYPEITPAQVEKILIETAKPWADGVSARGVAGTTPYWGPSLVNNYNAGFTDKSACQITPAIAARAEANDASLDATYPGFRQMVQPRLVNGNSVDIDANLYVCRDFKRGHGLVDAEAAVLAALALAGDSDPTGTPEVKITTPEAGAVITDAQTTIAGLVDRDGSGPNTPPTATLAASATTGPSPLTVDFSLAGSDSDGLVTGYTLSFGDGSAPLAGSAIPTGAARHVYTTDGTYTATLTVTDDDAASTAATVAIVVGGLPVPDGTVTGETFAYNAPPANIGVSNVAAIATGAATSDAVPKYPPGAAVSIAVRNGQSADANVPITTATPGRLVILDATGVKVAGPITMTPSADTDPVTSEQTVRWSAGDFTIPADWSGRYYLAAIVTSLDQDHYVQSQTFLAAPHYGLKPIDVIGADAVGIPGLPGTTPGSDEGHSIGDADDDGAGPMGDIQWADTAADASYVTAVIKLGAVPVQPAGDSPFVYELFVNGVRIESYLFGTAPSLWDVTNGAEVVGGITTWDTTANTITLKVPVEYLASVGESAPYSGHVEAMVGEGLAAGVVTVDRAPDAGERDLRAAWQRIVPALRMGSASDPDNTDPSGDSTGGLPFLDVTKVWVSREDATTIDITMAVADLASAPPSVDAGAAKAATNYGSEFCVDNAAQTYTATSGNYAGVAGVVCYRLSASNGALGVTHAGGSLQKDGSGSCGLSGITKAVSFNTAANTITWTIELSGLNVKTVGAAVADCNTTPPTRDAPVLVAGNKVSRLVASTGMSAGALVVLTASTDSMAASAARTYTMGGSAPALVANAGIDVTGGIGDSIAIAGSATGGSAPYTCAWSTSSGVFADANACSTSVSYDSAGVRTLTLTVTDSLGATAVDTASVNVVGATVEHVRIVIGGSVTVTAPVDTSSASTAAYSVVADLSGLPNGETDIVATWFDAAGAQLATTTRRVDIQLDGSVAFVEILSPEADATVQGQSLVSGSAGHRSGAAPAALPASNHYGLPLWSGQNGGRAAVTLDGFIEAPCATCAPGQLDKPVNQIPDGAWNPIANNVGPIVDPTLFNNLGANAAWGLGPDSDAQGIDGYWFNIAGHGGDAYELTDASGFDVFMDIRFSNDWLDGQDAELGAQNGPTATKTGTVPAAANWAFVYIRMGDMDTAANQFEGAPSLKLTPTIVPPGAVQGLAATSGPNTVALSWAAPLNDGGELTGYKVQRDGADLATVSVPGYVDTPGDALTHVYAVTAFNSAGNGAPSAVNGAAGAPAVSVAITSPSNGAVGVSGATAISGTYMPGSTGGGGGSGAFANTHYIAVLNLNSACGDPLGYGDHVIVNKLTDHAVDVLGLPAANVHIYNEKGIALTSSIDSANYNKLTSAWKTGAAFDGPARWSVVEPAMRAIAESAAAGEAADGAPARIFFLESSHGLQASLLLGDGATDSLFCLDDVDVSSTMLGDLLNDIDADVAAAHSGVAIEWSINIDCSFCGGFIDSPLPAPGVTAVNTAGVVGPNRVVEVGCTWVTECFGNPAVTYDYMFNECTFTGKADGYGPLVETLYGTGTDGSDVGYEVLVGSSTYAAKDGAITLEESYWCAIETAHASFTDPIAIQQMFQISDNLQSDMFGLSGFPLWEADSSIDLGAQDPSLPLDLTKLPLADTRAADPTGDGATPFTDLVSLEAAATTTEILADLGVADLTLSSLEFEDEVQYDLFINDDRYSACYLLGETSLWGWNIPSEDPVTGEPTTGAPSGGTVVYDTANGLIHFRIPISELTDQTLPASAYSVSVLGDCGFSGLREDDRVPDGTGVVMTSEADDNSTLPGADKVTVSLTGPATVSGDATLNAAASTWAYDPAGDLADGLWTATATLYHNAGSGFVQVGTPSTLQFRVGLGSDLEAPSAPVVSIADKTTSTVSLSWTASTDNVGVDHYEVRRGGVAIGTTSALNYVDTGLASSTSYTYVIKAFDAAGNSASSAPKVATTDGITTPLGIVTLSTGSTLLGTAEIDTSSGDPVNWEILVDWTSLPEGATQIIADYDDGQGLTATTSLNVVVTRGVGIDITSPTAGANVMPTFTTTGTVEGAGGPQGFATSSYMFADGTLNTYHPGYMLSQTNVLKDLETALKNTPGFLGVSPDLSGELVVNAYFTGPAPATPSVALPEGWTLKMNGDVTLERAITKYPANFRVREGPPAPAQAQKLGPGSHLIQTMPTGTFGCTANFVWEDTQGKYYLGAAGHCFLPADKTSTHGPGKDYDRNLTTVKVCVSNCQFGGQMGFIISGNMVPLGKVAYARQTLNGADVGNDFGIVEIPVSLYDQVRAEMPVWNGPTQLGTLEVGEPAVLYGNSVGFGETWPTMARGGFGSVFNNANSWSAVLPSAPGDSGSALVSAHVADTATNVVEGFEAVGALTHLSGAGPVVGTTMTRAKAMAAEAGLTITAQMQGAIIAPPAPTVPDAPTLNTLTPGTTTMGLTWTAPTNDGNSAITGYTIRYGTSAGSYTGTKNVSAVTSATVTGLAPATQYYFVVKAVNAVGASVASNEQNAATQVLQTVPSAPVALQAFADNGKVTLTWDAPASDGGAAITSYTVSYAGGPSGSLTTGNVNQATVTGLTNGVQYTFTVAATNAVGTGPASNQATATPNGALPPAFTVELRGDVGATEVFAWTPADSFDGSSFSHEFTNAPGGALTVTARLLQDGVEVRSTSVAVHVLSAPTLTTPASVAGNERQAVEFTATATDADGPAGLTFSLVSAPAGATIGAGSGAFSWTPDYGQDGTHTVTVKVTDPEGLADQKDVELVIGLANKPPVLGAIGNKLVGEGETLSFTLTATDRENDVLTYSATNMPAGATLNSATGEFSWTPDFGTEGNYPVTFHVSDGVSSDSKSIVITVGNVNRPPVLDPIGPLTVAEGQILSLSFTASDPDGGPLGFGATGLPAGAALTLNGAFIWMPSYTQAGVYFVTVTVTDGELSASEIVTITVTNVDRAPVLTTIPNRQVLQQTQLRVPLAATDPDTGDVITWEFNGPATAAIENGANGIATLVWTPTLSDLGARTVTVVARSGPDALIASQSFVVTVNFKTDFTATHSSSSYVEGSPSQVVTITANFTNTGPQSDTFALSLGMSALWKHSSLPSTITLAPGESALVSVNVTFPTDLAVSYATISATSVGNASKMREARFRLDVPVVVTLSAMGHLTNAIDVPTGTVHVTHLDGTPAVGAIVVVRQMHMTLGGQTATSQNGVTDAEGDFDFDLSGDAKSVIPGKHQLVIVAKKVGGFEKSLVTTYTVGANVI